MKQVTIAVTVTEYYWWDYRSVTGEGEICPMCSCNNIKLNHMEVTQCPQCKRKMVTAGASVFVISPNNLLTDRTLLKILSEIAHLTDQTDFITLPNGT